VPIQGSLEEVALPDVLQLLALGRKSGCLIVVNGEMRGDIWLEVGRVSFATLANRPDRLGELLVKSGRITRQQLTEATKKQARSSGRQLGKILVESGRISRGLLERFLKIQVEEAVYSMFTWRHGEFTFSSSQRPPSQCLLVTLDPESLLLEGARRVDEWSLIEMKIPSFDLVYRLSPSQLGKTASADLTEEQKRIIPLLDGTHDVNSIVELTGMSDFDIGKALYGLLVAGLAQLVERRSQIRHLEYRELLAYLMREAEFADAQRRKDTGRHILDCPTCSERLRKLHVRRTTEGAAPPEPEFGEPAVEVEGVRARGSAPPAALSPEPTVEAVPAAAASPARAPTRPRAPAVRGREAESAPLVRERRRADRRSGRDRRRHERRCGHDRRRGINPTWLQVNEERRQGPRRASDGDGGHRQAWGDYDRRRAAAAAPPGAPATTPGSRTTVARRLPPLDARAWERVSPPLPSSGAYGEEPEEEAPPEATFTPAAELRAPARPPILSQAEPESEEETEAPATETAAERTSGDMPWIVTPRESFEMIRESRSKLRASGPVRPAASASESLVRERELPRAPAQARWERPVRSWPAPSGRSIAIAAGIAGVALLGYLAGRSGEAVPNGGAVQTAEASPAEPRSAEPAEPGPERAASPRVREPATSPARPEGTTTTAPIRAAGREPPPVAPRERAGRPAAETELQTAAQPRPGDQPPAQQRATQLAASQPPAPQPAAPAAQPAAVTPTPAPTQPATLVPAVATVRGAVRDAGGRPLAGAQISVRGTTLSAVTDASGGFEIRGVPEGAVVLQASATGYTATSREVRAVAGSTVTTELNLRAPPTSAEPDRELAAGGWAPSDRADAAAALGGILGLIEGLHVESISRSTSGTRARVRVVQLTESGERIVLTETLAGASVRAAGPARLTALRIVPPSEAYPLSTGTASLGNLLITARSSLAPDALRALLERLGDAAGR
jgi:hypothetical protein